MNANTQNIAGIKNIIHFCIFCADGSADCSSLWSFCERMVMNCEPRLARMVRTTKIKKPLGWVFCSVRLWVISPYTFSSMNSLMVSSAPFAWIFSLMELQNLS